MPKMITVGRLIRALNRAGINGEAKDRLVAQFNPGHPKNIKLSRKHVQRLEKLVANGRLAAVYCSGKGKISIWGKDSVTLKPKNWNFLKEDVRGKALLARATM